MSTEVKSFTWSQNKLDVAKAISVGTKNQRAIAKEFDIREETICRWKREPEFMAKVDEYTLSYEKATKAGLLREAYKGMGIKEKHIEEDKSTHLDYVKYVSKVQGHEVERVEHSGGVAIELKMMDCSEEDDES